MYHYKFSLNQKLLWVCIQTSRDMGRLSPGDLHIGRWFCRNIHVSGGFFSLFFQFSEENIPIFTFFGYKLHLYSLKFHKIWLFKQESCRHFWSKTARPQVPKNIIEVCCTYTLAPNAEKKQVAFIQNSNQTTNISQTFSIFLYPLLMYDSRLLICETWRKFDAY